MTSMRIFRAAQVATIVLAGLAMAACANKPNDQTSALASAASPGSQP